MTSKEMVYEVIENCKKSKVVNCHNCILIVEDGCALDFWEEDLDRLEKLEKAIEIMVRCNIVPHTAREENYEGYIYLHNYCCWGEPYPTEEEYKLLKEVLCDGKMD